MNRQPEGRQVTNYLCLTKNSNNGNKESTLSVLPEDRQVEQPQEVRQVLRKAIQPHRAGHARTGRAHDRPRTHSRALRGGRRAERPADLHPRAAAAGHEREAAGPGNLPCEHHRTRRRQHRCLQRAEAHEGHPHAIHPRPDVAGQEDGQGLQGPVLDGLRRLRRPHHGSD